MKHCFNHDPELSFCLDTRYLDEFKSHLQSIDAKKSCSYLKYRSSGFEVMPIRFVKPSYGLTDATAGTRFTSLHHHLPVFIRWLRAMCRITLPNTEKILKLINEGK